MEAQQSLLFDKYNFNEIVFKLGFENYFYFYYKMI
jgi:hypothetical protein